VHCINVLAFQGAQAGTAILSNDRRFVDGSPSFLFCP